VSAFQEEPGEELRDEFQCEYGKIVSKDTPAYGQGLDMHRLPHGGYRSMVTHYAWVAFRHGRGVFNPNERTAT